MICPKAKERFQAYADGELSGPDLMELEEHLSSCETCAAGAARRKANSDFLRERLALLTGRVEPDLGFLDEIVAAPKKTAATGMTDAAPTRRLPAYVPVVAVVVILAGAGWWFFGRDTGETPEDGGKKGRPEAARVPGEGADGPRTGRETKPPPEKPGTEPKTPERRPYKPVPVRDNLAMILPQLRKSPTQLRLEKSWTAAAKESDAADKILAELATAEEDRERVGLVLALAVVNDDRAARGKLTSVLSADASPAVRGAAAAALGRGEGGGRIRLQYGLSVESAPIEDEEIRRALLDAAVSERESSVLTVLIQALARSQQLDPAITPRMMELARMEEPKIREAALASLAFAKPASVSELMALVEDGGLPLEARTRLVKLAPGVDSVEGIRAVIGYLENAQEEEMQLTILGILAGNPTEEGISAAKGVLTSSAPSGVRLAALGIVAASPTERKTLEEFTEDPDEAVREAARSALKRAGEEKKQPKDGAPEDDGR